MIDHDLNYIRRGTVTEDVEQEVDKFKTKMNTKNITKHVNEKFAISLKEEQIRYLTTKLTEKNFGKPDNDAFAFLTLAQQDVLSNGGFFALDRGTGEEFKSIIYISASMLSYAKSFLDLVIIDATYKKNRFNLPLLNVIGVNNYGANIMLAFGLLADEKQLTYDWFFAQLKRAWKQNPINVITDDCQEMQNGNYFVSSSLFIVSS